MRAIRGFAVLLAALLTLTLAIGAIEGCKKRETKPAPQVAAATASLLRYNSRQWGL